MLVFITVAITIWASNAILPAYATWQCSSCEIKYEAVGCFADNRARPLPYQVLNERDPKSKVFGNRRIDWMNWNTYLPQFACRCAKIVKAKGWSVFGLQFYGECWSGPTGESDYDLKGASEKCVGPDYKPCNSIGHRHCVGKHWTNFVYRIVDGHCDLKFEKIDCYNDVNVTPRLLPNYVLTDRESDLSISSGRRISWRNWDVYMPEFVCRCAKKAKEAGDHIFGVQYYGECWTGPKGDETYDRKGRSGRCVNQCFQKCQPFNKYCAGMHFANAVYRFEDAPCEVSVQPKGCYSENPYRRALRIPLVNEVDPSSRVFNGHIFDFDNWEEEFKKLLCRCARAAKSRKLSEFGVNDHGACWGDRYSARRITMYGDSDKCYTKFNRSCDGNMCAGGPHANFVYEIVKQARRSEIPFDNDFVASTDEDMATYLTAEHDSADGGDGDGGEEVPSDMIQPTNEPFPTGVMEGGNQPAEDFWH